MIFISPREVELFADFVQQNWAALDPSIALVAKKGAKGDDEEELPDAEPAESEPEPAASAKRAGKGKKAAAKPADMEVKLDKEVLNKMKDIFDAPSMDISLFGRFMADRADFIVDAACQVAHALGVNKIEREFDFFTAMDDRAAAGSGQHLGVVEFNAPTYYRYAVIDTDLLLENLKGEKDLAREAVKVFLEALAKAIPTGKQNSFAAHNMPAFVAVVARAGGAMNLANAFEQPLRPRTDAALTTQSVEALLREDDWVSAAFGTSVGEDRWAYIDKTDAWTKGQRKSSMTDLASWSAELAYGA
jgi:CRISPR system Cascade subunit CasC